MERVAMRTWKDPAMSYTPDFGRFGPDLPAQAPAPSRACVRGVRIVILGDFAGRAHRGELRRPEEIARLKPIRLDVDTFERVVEGFATVLHLPVGAGGACVEVHARSLDDLHPDALVELPVFGELARLRAELAHPKTAQAAATEVRRWIAAAGEGEGVGTARAATPARARRARGNSLPVDAKLGDFARLLERPTAAPSAASPLEHLLRSSVAPHVMDADVPDAQALTAAIDRAQAATMRALLHHPDLQCLEAAWRSLDFVARRVDAHARLQVVLYDIAPEEFAADLAGAAQLEDTGLYRLLVEEATLDAHQGLPSAIVADYRFEMTPPHAELLGRVAQIAARANAPFVAAIGNDALAVRDEDLHPMIVDAWAALRALPEAAWLALAAPRFLLRAPYGERGEPVDCFEFEEFDARAGLKTLLWGNPAMLVAVLLAAHADAAGRLAAPGRVLSLPEMPWFAFADAEGEVTALPCTERLLTERQAAQAQGRGVLPVLAIKGRPEVRLGGFRSVAGGALAGPWGVPAAPAAPRPAPAIAATIAAGAAPRPGTTAVATLAARAGGSAGADDPAAPADDASPDRAAEAGGIGAPHGADADAELDALLAGLEDAGAAAPAPAADAELDPELAALLEGL
jgi:type VI secretion system protein ImpC